ncbi:MAG TPA: diheme cytochrome c [Ramlibacter sp.]|nr:diheme cytochrome c [Ramlibacter sp.]
MHRLTRGPVLTALYALIATLAAGSVFAEGEHAMRAPLLPKYQQECAACHVAYPPGLLPAASWQRITSNLSRHFGTDASLDAASTRELSAWLAANAATSRRVQEAPPDDRITRSAWFARKHDDVPARAWKLPAVKSAANCNACHQQAQQGIFNEHDVRVPR